METRKNFKITSITVLVLAFAAFIKLLTGLFFEDMSSAGNVDADAVFATQIILLVLSSVLLLPRIYVGVKGLIVAKDPSGRSNGHIIWAIILLVLSIMSVFDPVVAMINKESVAQNLPSLAISILEASVYFAYIKYGKAVLKEADQE